MLSACHLEQKNTGLIYCHSAIWFVLIGNIAYTNGIKTLRIIPDNSINSAFTWIKNLFIIVNKKPLTFLIGKLKINIRLIRIWYKLHLVGSQPGVLYGLAKVHKKVIDGCPGFDQLLQLLGHPDIRQLSFSFLYLKI